MVSRPLLKKHKGKIVVAQPFIDPITQLLEKRERRKALKSDGGVVGNIAYYPGNRQIDLILEPQHLAHRVILAKILACHGFGKQNGVRIVQDAGRIALDQGEAEHGQK